MDRIIFGESTSLKSILERFNETAIHTENRGFAIITNKEGKCIGVVSDGDIRRKLIKGISIDDPIKNTVNKNYSYVTLNDSSHKMLRQFDRNIANLVVLDEDERPVDLYQYSRFVASTRTDQRIIRARVPVRVSFSGGGTDMSKYINLKPTAVLSTTINKYCTSSVIIRDDDEIHINSKDLNIKYSAENINKIEFGDKLDLIKAAIKIMQPDFGFNLETFAEFEPGTGLGGSSALVVSVIGALNYFRNDQQLDIYQLADVAYQVERIDMKIRGGWQDQYVTSFGGFNYLEFHKNEVIVTPMLIRRETILELEYNLMLFRLGGKRSSSKIQEKHIIEIENNSKVLNLFSEMSKLTRKMKEALLRGKVKTFGDLLHSSWLLKRKMNTNVSNKLIEDCYKSARDLGALGGKILGAGGSGYLLVYASPLYHKQIKKAFAEMEVFQEMFKFNQRGLEVWTTKR